MLRVIFRFTSKQNNSGCFHTLVSLEYIFAPFFGPLNLPVPTPEIQYTHALYHEDEVAQKGCTLTWHQRKL